MAIRAEGRRGILSMDFLLPVFASKVLCPVGSSFSRGLRPREDVHRETDVRMIGRNRGPVSAGNAKEGRRPSGVYLAARVRTLRKNCGTFRGRRIRACPKIVRSCRRRDNGQERMKRLSATDFIGFAMIFDGFRVWNQPYKKTRCKYPLERKGSAKAASRV